MRKRNMRLAFLMILFCSVNILAEPSLNLKEIIDSGDETDFKTYSINLSKAVTDDNLEVPITDSTGNKTGYPALGYSLITGKYTAAWILLNRNDTVNINFKTHYETEHSPLSFVLSDPSQLKPLIFLLLEKGADVNYISPDSGKEIILSLKNKIGKNDNAAEIFKKEWDDAEKSFYKTESALRKIIDKDNVSELKKAVLIDINYYDCQVEITEKSSRKVRIPVMDYSVMQGALNCFKYLKSIGHLQSPDDAARKAIEFNRMNILREVIKDVQERDFMWVLGKAYISRNEQALKIILPYVKNLEKIEMFNGDSLFDYAWRTQNIVMVMDTINSFKDIIWIQKLFKYVLDDDLANIRKNVNETNISIYKITNDCTLVHLAAFLGRNEILQYLLSLYSTDNNENSGYLGSKPVFLSVLMKNEKAFKMLADHEKQIELYHKIYIDVTDPFTLADYAYLYLGADAAEYLYDKKPDYITELIGYGFYTHDLNMAIKKNDIKYVIYLITEYEPQFVNCTVSLKTAVEFSRYEIIDLFIKRGYDFNNFNELIEKAIEKDNLEMYRYLINTNSDYDTEFDIYHCALNNSVSILKELLRKNISNKIILKNKVKYLEEDTSPLFAAVSRNNYEAAEILLQNKADVNYRNPKGATLLFKAVENENFQMVKLLIENGADINDKFQAKAGNLSYLASYFGIGEKKTDEIFTVMDFNQSYSIYRILKKAGAKFAWE